MRWTWLVITAFFEALLAGALVYAGWLARGDSEAGTAALVLAAWAAWALVLALVVSQFWRQRRLARRLDDLEARLRDRPAAEEE